MGIISKGILGPFSGTVGTVIGGTWKGIPYIRSRPLPTEREPSLLQLEQRARFALILRFLQTMTPLLHVSFKSMAVKMSGFNSALSYNIKNAVTGIFPDYELDYSMVLVSRGDLPNALNPEAELGAGTSITYTWTDNSGMGKAAPTDNAILVVYCPERSQCIFDFGAERSTETDNIAIAAFAGLEVQTWVGFISQNAKNVATSVYTGQFTIPVL
jgi:hypothetical protein